MVGREAHYRQATIQVFLRQYAERRRASESIWKMNRVAKNSLTFLSAVAASAAVCLAQDKPDAPTPKIPAATSTHSPASHNIQEKGDNPQQDENPKRILGIIPNFISKDDIPQNRRALTPREKYALAYHQTVDFSAHLDNAFQAMLQQASDGQPHYGQGWGAYAKRFAASEADNASSSFLVYGVLPHLLKQDPRYFRRRYGSVWSRMKYSASRTVITYTDEHQPTFNAPKVVGVLLQQGISRAYYPAEDRTARRMFQNWGITLAYAGAYNVLKEFYPDFLKIVFHRNPTAQLDPARCTANPNTTTRHKGQLPREHPRDFRTFDPARLECYLSCV
jgi:hypothetical protein